MAASPPPPSPLEWSLAMQIHTLKACQGLKRGLFNLCKAVWALSPLCSGDVENFKAGKKNDTRVKRRRRRRKKKPKTRQQQLATKRPCEPRQIYMFHSKTGCKICQRCNNLKREKMMGTCFLWPPTSADTHTHGKIHPRKTIPASARLNQQRESVSFPASEPPAA